VNQIFLDKFVKVAAKFNINLREEEIENIYNSFPGKDEGNKKKINIMRIYD
jgi:hypothetical protein